LPPVQPAFIDKYLQLLDLAYQVIESLAGKTSTDLRLPDCHKLAIKLFFHAASTYWLQQGTKAPVPHSPKAYYHVVKSFLNRQHIDVRAQLAKKVFRVVRLNDAPHV
jgi:hypothetical protein